MSLISQLNSHEETSEEQARNLIWTEEYVRGKMVLQVISIKICGDLHKAVLHLNEGLEEVFTLQKTSSADEDFDLSFVAAA